MKTSILAAILLTTVSLVIEASEIPTGSAAALIQKVDKLNDQCRGGSGASPATQAACDQREITMKLVEKAGWCWGPLDSIGADKRWIPCSSDVGASAQPPDLPWFAADRNNVSCLNLSFSPADWIRELQETGVRPQIRDLPGGAVEVSAENGNLRITRTFFRNKASCLSTLLKSHPIPSRYE